MQYKNLCDVIHLSVGLFSRGLKNKWIKYIIKDDHDSIDADSSKKAMF